MANLIGQYIHFRYSNYQRFGLRSTDFGSGESPPASPADIYREQHLRLRRELERIRRGYSQTRINELNDRLNYFFSQGGNTRKVPLSNIGRNILKAIEKTIGPKLNDYDFNARNLHIAKKETLREYRQALSEEQRRNLSNMSHLSHNEYTFISSIQERINMISLLIERANLNNVTDASLNNMLNNLMSWWDSIRQDLGANQTTVSGYHYFIQELNRAIEMFKPGASQLSGVISEYVACLSDYAYSHGANIGVDELIRVLQDFQHQKSTMLKSHKGLSEINIDMRIVKNMAEISAGGSHVYTQDMGLFTINATEDKIDLILNDRYNTPISLKNYNLRPRNTNIHLLSGSSLLGLVQEFTTFVNHYLNIITLRRTSNHNINMSNRDLNAPMSARRLMHTIMKLTVFVKAISGGVYARKGNVSGQTMQTELFVVNDTSKAKGNFKIYHLVDIYDRVFNNIQLLRVNRELEEQKIHNTFISSHSSSLDLNGRSARRRITNILNEMHLMKLNVSIHKNALR